MLGTLLLVLSAWLDVPKCVFAQTSTATTSAQAPVSTKCGDLMDLANKNGNHLFWAVDVYECLMSVPFLDAVAYRYIDYYNSTIQFQSTLAYLKNPPTGYQQPAIDVLAALEEIKRNVAGGKYQNQYQFEVHLQKLVMSMHDSHVTLNAGILAAFSFGSPWNLVSLSEDGKQDPKIYLADDVLLNQQDDQELHSVDLINGEDAIKYLRRFAALNSEGSLEANTDWNMLFYTPVQDILENGNVFGWNVPFYPGEEELTLTFSNEEIFTFKWIATYNNLEQTGPLTTGGDFYNYFVLGLLPASYVPQGDDSTTNNAASDSSSSEGLTSWHDVSTAYPPDPFVKQDDLGGAGYVTGYFLDKDNSTAVLSIPSFDAYGIYVAQFLKAVDSFIQEAKNNGCVRVIIDLQQNTGGASLLAHETFYRFFPHIEPFGGSRRRNFPLEDVLGSTITSFWTSLREGDEDYDLYYGDLASDEWVVTSRLNAAGNNFTSWEQYNEPVANQNDYFSQVERYNLSSNVFMTDALGTNKLFIRPREAGIKISTPWQASQIVLLTDGLCGSTCALFVEMMTHEAGVRTVVVGGLPGAGPMQAVSGSRGASSYSADRLNSSIVFARDVNLTAAALLPQIRDEAILTNNLGFNLRDQIRRGQDMPLQFQYEAAHCRIYYTLANAFNMRQLWTDAARAIFDDQSLCVMGSRGNTSNSINATAEAPQYDTGPGSFIGIGTSTRSNPSTDGIRTGGLTAGDPTRNSDGFVPADGDNCDSFTQLTPVRCPDGSDVKACAPSCTGGTPCGNGEGFCYVPKTSPADKARQRRQSDPGSPTRKATSGWCKPLSGTKAMGCHPPKKSP